MGNFPFFRFPYRNYYDPYYSHYNPTLTPKESSSKNEPIEEKDKVRSCQNQKEETKKISSKHNSFANFNFSNLFSSNCEEPILEILGISLYLDDLILLGLLFFLYTEGVQDEILFIILILLLLS